MNTQPDNDMSKHTPGPWAVFKPTILPDATFGIDGADGSAVVYFGVDCSNGIRKIEDAHLIAAAPDLLEALKLCSAELFAQCDGPRAKHYVAIARAAIAKATGEQT